jgi:hypothetical protein
MTTAEELRELIHQAKNHPTADQIYTQLQVARAESGFAAGQCPDCGNFRSDGLPPVLHHPGCSHADDWKADPLSFL